MHSKINILSKTHAGRVLIGFVVIGVLLLWLTLSAPNTAQSSDDCAPTRLEPWAQAQVPEGQATNRLRNAPDLNGAIMGEIPVLVPICEDGILWWEVETRGERAFTAEADGDEYFLERINNDCPASELLPGGAAFLVELNAREVDLYSRPRLEASFAPTPTNRRDTLYLTEQSVCAQNTR